MFFESGSVNIFAVSLEAWLVKYLLRPLAKMNSEFLMPLLLLFLLPIVNVSCSMGRISVRG